MNLHKVTYNGGVSALHTHTLPITLILSKAVHFQSIALKIFIIKKKLHLNNLALNISNCPVACGSSKQQGECALIYYSEKVLLYTDCSLKATYFLTNQNSSYPSKAKTAAINIWSGIRRMLSKYLCKCSS